MTKHIYKVFILSFVFVGAVITAHAEKRIKLKLNTTGELVVPDEPRVWETDNVVWEIQGSGIRSFRIKDSIHVSNVYYPFTQDLPSDQRQVVSMVVKRSPAIVEWYYEIEWIDGSGVTHLLDPKIPVKPAPLAPLLETILVLAVAITSILAITFRNRWLKTQAELTSLRKDSTNRL